MKLRLSLPAALGVALGLVAASPSVAEVPAGWYATGTAGLVTQPDQRFELAGAAGASQTIGMDSGFLAGAALGRQFANGWRAEAEFIYQSVDHGAVAGAIPGVAGSGNYASTSVALNALYEFNLFGSPRARTYVGAGIAYLTEVDIDFEAGASERSFSGSDVGVQLLLGARYDLTERVFLDAGLRYLRVTGVDLDDEAASGTLQADYEPLAVTVSFGWRF